MPQMPEARALSRAIRRHGIGLVGHYGQRIVKAQVVDASPLTVELLHSDIQITDDHLLLGTWVRYYDDRYGLGAGDTVLLTQTDDEDWFVIDVVADEDFNLGDHPEDLVTLTAFDSELGSVLAKIPYRDFDGAALGSLLAFDPARIKRVTEGTWTAGPPGSPSDGDRWIAYNVDAGGTVWKFRYNAGSASAYKWERVGGEAALSQLITADAGTSGAWTPDNRNKILCPRAGDYLCRYTGFFNNVGASATEIITGVDDVAVATPGRPWGDHTAVAAGGSVSISVERVVSGVTAGHNLGGFWIGQTQQVNVDDRSFAMSPKRIA